MALAIFLLSSTLGLPVMKINRLSFGMYAPAQVKIERNMRHYAGFPYFAEGRKGYESARACQATCQELQVSLAHVRETSCALQGMHVAPKTYEYQYLVPCIVVSY